MSLSQDSMVYFVSFCNEWYFFIPNYSGEKNISPLYGTIDATLTQLPSGKTNPFY